MLSGVTDANLTNDEINERTARSIKGNPVIWLQLRRARDLIGVVVADIPILNRIDPHRAVGNELKIFHATATLPSLGAAIKAADKERNAERQLRETEFNRDPSYRTFGMPNVYAGPFDPGEDYRALRWA